MRFFYDTEFIEDGKTIDLISLGVVADDGREFYAQNSTCDFDKANGWVRANVFPHLTLFNIAEVAFDGRRRGALPLPWMLHEDIGAALREFVGDDTPEFWGYYSAYDHVALCQLFGKMIDLPSGWPFYTRDLRQLADSLGLKDALSRFVPAENEHNALADARWNKRVWEYLMSEKAQGALAA